MARPEYKSYTQISRYQTCPHSYYLHYVQGLRPPQSSAVNFGQAVHASLELGGDIPEKHQDFVGAVNLYIRSIDDEIVSREQSFTVHLGGHEIQGKIDALTKGKRLFDYKVTSAPSYYKGFVPYQLMLYKIAYPEYSPEYILLKRGKRNEFLGLSTVRFTFHDAMVEQFRDYLKFWSDQIESSDRSQVWPPLYTGCFNCDLREHCQFYVVAKGRKDDGLPSS